MQALKITNLTKRYGKTTALNNLSLSVPQGAFFGLLGHNGAGKSTLINCITGIGNFQEGSITIFGNDVQQEYQLTRASIGLSPQEFNADIFAPIENTLDYVGGYFGMKPQERKQRIDEVIDMFDLHAHRKKPFKALSGGLKRRAILARALMHDPDLLILDEPTAGIDVEQRHALWKYLEQFHKDGKTIILTSHYLEEVERLCERVAIIHDGMLLKELDKSEFTGEHKLEEVYLQLTGSDI